MNPAFFKSPAEFRTWLERHHEPATELWVGFYKKSSGKVGISYSEALDQALCFGWIDGVRKRVDADSYMNRFSPRAPKSVWSTINIKRAKVLKRRGLMKPSGLQAFESRDPAKSGIYSFENRPATLDAALERLFKGNRNAFSFFQAQPPGYRRTVIWYVMSAKQHETRVRRLAHLIRESARGLRLGMLTGRKEEAR